MRPVGYAALALLLAPVAAEAAWPEDVTLSAMTTFEGRPQTDQSVLSADYGQVVRELAAAISTHTIMPPSTLGLKGFEVTFDTNIAFVDVYRHTTNIPAPWERVHVNGQPGNVHYSPGLTVRKGLPFSIELGMTGRWIGESRQGIFGGFIRVGAMEDFAPWPDLGVNLGYTAYIGNDELEMGVFTLGGSIGKAFDVGPKGGLRSARITPFADVALLVAYAAPLLDDATAEAIGAVPFGHPGRNANLEPQPPITMARFSGGVEVKASYFVLRLSGGYTINALANVAVAVGFNY